MKYINKFKVFNILNHGDFLWFLYPISQPFTFFGSDHPEFLTDTDAKKAIVKDFCNCANDFLGYEKTMLKKIQEDTPDRDFLILTLFGYCEQHKRLLILRQMYPFIKDDYYWNIAYHFAEVLLELDTNPDVFPASFWALQKMMIGFDIVKLYSEVMADTEYTMKITLDEFRNSYNKVYNIKKSGYEIIV